MKRDVDKIIGVYLSVALVVNAIDLSVFNIVVPRIFAQAGSSLIIFLLFIFMLITKKFQPLNEEKFRFLILISLSFTVIFILPEFLAFSLSFFIQVGKVLTLFCMLWILFSRPKISEYLLVALSAWALVLGLIACYSLIWPINANEIIPVLNITSSRSIVFEQNVFGIFMFMTFLYALRLNRTIFERTILFIGMLSSYYRTVWAMAFFATIFNMSTRYLLLIATLASLLISIIGGAIFNALKLYQFRGLTGRSELWSIGLQGFDKSPFFGNGFSEIPDYAFEAIGRAHLTSFHNVFIDTLFASGILGFSGLVLLYLIYFSMAGKHNLFIGVMILSPSLFNTYFPFSPNLLGGFVAAFCINSRYNVNANLNSLVK